MRKLAFCICENKDADQLCGDREADQRLCFPYTDSTIPLVLKSEISSLYPSSVVVQPGLCRTWSETPKTGFLRTRLIYSLQNYSKFHRHIHVLFPFFVSMQASTLEPRCEKTGLWGFRPGPTQTGLCSHTRWLEA